MSNTMRVGMIVYGLDRALTGISRYTLELVQAFEALDEQVEIVLLEAGEASPLKTSRFRRVSLPGCRRLPGLMTLGHVVLPAIARQLDLDVIHDPTGVTPLLFGGGRAKIVTTVHDVIPLVHPQYSSRADQLIYRHWLPLRLPRNHAVIASSAHTYQAIESLLRIPPSRIHMIHLGVRDLFTPVPREQAIAYVRRFKIEHPYILFVGNLTQRKNVQLALRGFAAIRVKYPDLRFVLVGPRIFRQTPIEALVDELGISDRVIVTGSVEDEDLPQLYSAAEMFVFPSLYEGFGFPVLEAMACGTPVLTSAATSLPEVAGDAALVVDPDNVEEMAAAMERLLTDTELRDQLRERGLAQAARFTWEKTARQTQAVYKMVGNHA